MENIARSITALPDVEYAEPDRIMFPALTPNDPQYVSQWHYFGTYGINLPAAWYYLWVNSSSGNVIRKWFQASAICDATTCSVTADTTLGGGNHTWWVQTWNNAGYDPWSAGMNFSLPVPKPPVAATLVSPSGNSADTTPTYTWNEISDSAQGDAATWYYLWVNGVAGNVFKQWYQASATCNGGICSVTPDLALVGGTYTWWIQTWNSASYGPWSSAKNFNVTQ